MKDKIIKNLKIYKHVTKLATPYIIITTLVVSTAKLCGFGFPFIKDEIEKQKVTKRINDTNNRIVIEETYEQSSILKKRNVDTLYIEGKWKKTSEGTYEREKKTYKLKNLDAKQKEAIFNNTIDKYELLELLNLPTKTEVEKRDKINSNIIQNNKVYQRVTLYEIKDSDIIKEKETSKENAASTFIQSAFLIVLNYYQYLLKKDDDKKQKKR